MRSALELRGAKSLQWVQATALGWSVVPVPARRANQDFLHILLPGQQHGYCRVKRRDCTGAQINYIAGWSYVQWGVTSFFHPAPKPNGLSTPITSPSPIRWHLSLSISAPQKALVFNLLQNFGTLGNVSYFNPTTKYETAASVRTEINYALNKNLKLRLSIPAILSTQRCIFYTKLHQSRHSMHTYIPTYP